MKKFDCSKYEKEYGKLLYVMCVFIFLQQVVHRALDYFHASSFIKGIELGIEFCAIIAIICLGFKWAKEARIQQEKEDKINSEAE